MGCDRRPGASRKSASYPLLCSCRHVETCLNDIELGMSWSMTLSLGRGYTQLPKLFDEYLYFVPRTVARSGFDIGLLHRV